MRKLNTNQSIAVGAGLILLGYVLFAGPAMSLFNSTFPNNANKASSEAETGVVIQDEVIGEGPVAEVGDVLTVHYVGTLADGKVFDSSLDRNTPFDFTLGVGQVIRGWDEGMVGMRVGGKRVLTISPEYGYGAQGGGPIPPNATLIFQVELLNVQKPSTSR